MGDPLNRKRKHHTIPQFLLRNFTDDNGDIFEFDLRLLKSSRRKPGGVAHTTDFYTTDFDEGSTDVIESALASLESAAAPIVDEILRGYSALSERDLDILIEFVAIQKLRVPAIRDHHSEFLDHVEQRGRQIAHSQGLDVEGATTGMLSELKQSRSRNSANDLMLTSHVGVYRLMRRRGWCITRLTGSTRFVISDNPVIITDMRPDTGPPYHDFLPYGEDSRIAFPLSPHVALVSYYEAHIAKEINMPEQVAVVLNYRQLMSAQQRVYASQDDFIWGILEGKSLKWSEYVEDSVEARQRAPWRSP